MSTDDVSSASARDERITGDAADRDSTGDPAIGGAAAADAAADPAVADAAAATPVAADPPPRRRIGILVGVAGVLLAVDLLTKILAVANLENRAPVETLGGLVYLQLIRNPGAAFSLGTGITWVFSLVMIAVVLVIAWMARRLRSAGWAVGLGLVLAGALGNLVDRLFRAPGPLHGHVVDFISVFSPNGESFAIFNVADMCINVGAAVIVLSALLGTYYDGTSTRKSKSGTAESAG